MDEKLKKAGKENYSTKSDLAIEESMKSNISLFSLLESRDVYLTMYQEQLSERLL